MTLAGAHRFYTVVVFIVLASLDNVAIGLAPPLFGTIAEALGTSQAAIGGAVAGTYVASAVAAVAWAYAGDRANRKWLLMVGTLLWAAGTWSTSLAGDFWSFVAAQLLAAVGLGAVGSVGFSVVSDLISPRRRGLVLSLWGLSQAVGTLVGGLLGGLLGGQDWRAPFQVLTYVGLAATLAYLFTLQIRRGQSEPALAGVFAAGGDYDHRIRAADLPGIARRRTNVWLVLQGFIGQIVFGSLVLLPLLFREKALDVGYSAATATAVGSVYATLFSLGGVFSVVGGLLGDRAQRRRPGGRARVAAFGILAGIPFYVILFFVPLRLDVPDGAGAGAVVTGVLASVVSSPVMAAGLLAALLAVGLTSANAPNWFALVGDVNPPEHRGTVFSVVNLVNGGGRAAGTALTGAVAGALQRVLPAPLNLAVTLAAFQAVFIPTGIMFLLAARSAPRDMDTVARTLAERADAAGPAAKPPPPKGPAAKRPPPEDWVTGARAGSG
jgi:MFS transporter, Spinster family, sphingosine-1-phosphate transporter